MRRYWRVDAAGQGSGRKMAATVTFYRLLCQRGAAALSLPRGARCFGVRIAPTGEKVTHTGQVSSAAWRRRRGRSPDPVPSLPGASESRRHPGPADASGPSLL